MYYFLKIPYFLVCFACLLNLNILLFKITHMTDIIKTQKVRKWYIIYQNKTTRKEDKNGKAVL